MLPLLQVLWRLLRELSPPIRMHLCWPSSGSIFWSWPLARLFPSQNKNIIWNSMSSISTSVNWHTSSPLFRDTSFFMAGKAFLIIISYLCEILLCMSSYWFRTVSKSGLPPTYNPASVKPWMVIGSLSTCAGDFTFGRALLHLLPDHYRWRWQMFHLCVIF